MTPDRTWLTAQAAAVADNLETLIGSAPVVFGPFTRTGDS